MFVVQGVNFREELQRLPFELPTIFDQVGKTICSEEIFAALAYHRALQEYLQNCEPPAVSVSAAASFKKDKKAKNAKALPADSSKQNALDDAFETVSAPFEFFSALGELRAAKDQGEQAAANLDFEAEAAEINWDFSIDGSGSSEEATIDWGIESASNDVVVATGNVEGAVDLDVPVEIDWDITSSDVGESVDASFDGAAAVDGIETLDVGVDLATSMETTRVGLLSENEFRTRIQNDLLELRTFLRQRKEELKGNDNVAFANQFQGSSGTHHCIRVFGLWMCFYSPCSFTTCREQVYWSNKALRRSKATRMRLTKRSTS